jgi:hypothetical protein
MEFHRRRVDQEELRGNKRTDRMVDEIIVTKKQENS